MTTISVGGEREESAAGVMEDEKIRRYSWQFCVKIFQHCVRNRRTRTRSDTYPAEEMPNEDDENAAGTIFVIGVQTLKGVLLPMLIEHR